jgi:hypothetical protein
MKEVTISSRSWHYWLVNEVYDIVPDNICAYLRAVLWCCFVVVAGSLIASGFLFILAIAIWEHPVTMLIWIVVAVSFLFVTIRYGRKDIHLPRSEFLAAAYESVHDKVCFKINYK